MSKHELKCWPNSWDAIADGRKRFEWRLDDRGYEVGDTLRLVRWNPQLYHGAGGIERNEQGESKLFCRVTYILRGMFGVPDGYCVMSIELIKGET